MLRLIRRRGGRTGWSGLLSLAATWREEEPIHGNFGAMV